MNKRKLITCIGCKTSCDYYHKTVREAVKDMLSEEETAFRQATAEMCKDHR